MEYTLTYSLIDKHTKKQLETGSLESLGIDVMYYYNKHKDEDRTNDEIDIWTWTFDDRNLMKELIDYLYYSGLIHKGNAENVSLSIGIDWARPSYGIFSPRYHLDVDSYIDIEKYVFGKKMRIGICYDMSAGVYIDDNGNENDEEGEAIEWNILTSRYQEKRDELFGEWSNFIELNKLENSSEMAGTICIRYDKIEKMYSRDSNADKKRKLFIIGLEKKFIKLYKYLSEDDYSNYCIDWLDCGRSGYGIWW